MGTRVSLDRDAKFLDRDLIAGFTVATAAPAWWIANGGRTMGLGGSVGAGEERFARTLVQQGLLHPFFQVHSMSTTSTWWFPYVMTLPHCDRS